MVFLGSLLYVLYDYCLGLDKAKKLSVFMEFSNDAMYKYF